PELVSKHDAYRASQKKLLETSQRFTQAIAKNASKGAGGKKAPEVKALSRTLAGLYDAFTRLVPEDDPRIPGVHYNLAETLFSIDEYRDATRHYRWIVSHWGQWGKAKLPSHLTLADASLKAIGSRYEVLRSKRLIPGKLKASKMSEDDGDWSDGIDPLLAEWVRWVDEYVDEWGTKKESVQTFVFESNRAL